MNLPMSCRVVGDKLEAYAGAALTVLPMNIRPTDAARDAELVLQDRHLKQPLENRTRAIL